MSVSNLSVLIEMGFSQLRAEKALEVTGDAGIEPAMNWLLAHPEEVLDQSSTVSATPEVSANGSQVDSDSQSANAQEAKSIKCDVCNKLFANNLEVEFHATKSGHDQFSENTEEKKPLTEEEKKEKLRLLEEKLKEKRKEREEKEKTEALQREKCRIRTGKEITVARKNLEELEMKKLIEQRKRDKEEERFARQRVKAQIEADKANRRLQSEGNKPVEVVVSSPVTSSAPAIPKEYTDTRIQIRLTDGKQMIQNFGCKEQLSAVRLYIEMNRTDGAGPFNLMTNFPKKIFTESDYEAPLDALGLAPSAVLIVQKKIQ